MQSKEYLKIYSLKQEDLFFIKGIKMKQKQHTLSKQLLKSAKDQIIQNLLFLSTMVKIPFPILISSEEQDQIPLDSDTK